MRKDGSRFWASVAMSALRDDDGRLRGFAKVTRDVSAQKAAEKKLRAYASQLERSNRDLESFASIASHDLQEPLRKIRAFGDLLVNRYAARLEPDARDYLERMRARGRTHAGAHRESPRRYSRVTTNPRPFFQRRPSPAGRAESRRVDLEGRHPANDGGVLEIGALPTIAADAMQMRQLLQNLLSNALKFHRPDVAPVVKLYARDLPRVRGRGECPRCELCVEDNGIGFEPQYEERIFGIFQRLHGRAEFDGTGIGLAICRRIVERHHGTDRKRSRGPRGRRDVHAPCCRASSPREEKDPA